MDLLDSDMHLTNFTWHSPRGPAFLEHASGTSIQPTWRVRITERDVRSRSTTSSKFTAALWTGLADPFPIAGIMTSPIISVENLAKRFLIGHHEQRELDLRSEL